MGSRPWGHTDMTERLNTHTPHHTWAAKLPFSHCHEHSVFLGLEGTLGTSLSPQENITVPQPCQHPHLCDTFPTSKLTECHSLHLSCIMSVTS